MTKNDLVKTAAEIPLTSKEAAKEYSEKLELLVSTMNKKMMERSDLIDMVGENNEQMMRDNHANHAQFIASILKNHNPEVLVETILWVFKAYRSRKFHSSYWAAQLNTWRTVIEETLSENTHNEVMPIYNWMQLNIPHFNELSDQKLEEINSKHLTS